MDRDQKINCTVASCKYNNESENKCILEAIQVSPTEGKNTKMADESMCASYKYEQ